MYNSKNLAADIRKHRGFNDKPVEIISFYTPTCRVELPEPMLVERSDKSAMDELIQILVKQHYENTRNMFYAAGLLPSITKEPDHVPIKFGVDFAPGFNEEKFLNKPGIKIITHNEIDQSFDRLHRALNNINVKEHEVVILDSIDYIDCKIEIPKFDHIISLTRSACGCSNPNRTENFAAGEKFHVCAKSKGGCGKEIP